VKNLARTLFFSLPSSSSSLFSYFFSAHANTGVERKSARADMHPRRRRRLTPHYSARSLFFLRSALLLLLCWSRTDLCPAFFGLAKRTVSHEEERNMWREMAANRATHVPQLELGWLRERTFSAGRNGACVNSNLNPNCRCPPPLLPPALRDTRKEGGEHSFSA
jgi:hypothetical protein